MGQRLYKRADSPNWYVNLGGTYRSTGCRDKRAADTRADELEREHRAGPAPDAAPQATVAQALDRAVTERRTRGRAEGTLAMWRVKGGHIERIFGSDTNIRTIDAAAVDRYTAQRTSPEEGASRSTVQKELSVLSVTLRLALRRGEYDRDPAAVLPQGWEIDYKPRERSLSPDEMRRLIADLADDDLPMVRGRAGPARMVTSSTDPVTSSYERTRQRSMANRAACVAFIVATSARWGEAERARREDVSEGFVLLRGSKTRSSWRTVPVLPTTASLLRGALEHGGEGLLFEPWTNVRRDLRSACARLKIPAVSPNDLRRTTGRWLRDAGVEPHLIAAVMGHRDSRMVERVYGKLPPEQLKALLLERVGGVVPLLPVGTKTAKAGKKRAG